MFDNNYTLLMILNQQLNRDKMIKEIKVTSHDLPFLTFFTSFLKIYSPGNTTWELKGLEPNGKKVCERQFQYLQLLSIEYWRHVKTGNNPSFRNNRGRQTCADENEFSIFCFHKILQVSQNSSFTNPQWSTIWAVHWNAWGKNHIFSQNLDSSLRLAEYFKNEDALVGW